MCKDPYLKPHCVTVKILKLILFYRMALHIPTWETYSRIFTDRFDTLWWFGKILQIILNFLLPWCTFKLLDFGVTLL